MSCDFFFKLTTFWYAYIRKRKKFEGSSASKFWEVLEKKMRRGGGGTNPLKPRIIGFTWQCLEQSGGGGFRISNLE